MGSIIALNQIVKIKMNGEKVKIMMEVIIFLWAFAEHRTEYRITWLRFELGTCRREVRCFTAVSFFLVCSILF
jgi:hypothetical protein